MRLEHLSPSSIGTFLNCQTQWYFRYVEGLKTPPAVALVAGSSVHKAAEANYTQKQESHEDLPVDELLDVTRDTFVKGSSDIVWELEDTTPGEALDQTVGLTKVWRQDLAPQVQPTAVETWIRLEDPSWALPLVGVIDTETDELIVDLKTAAKRKSVDAAGVCDELERDIQSGVYLLKHYREFSPRTFRWHVAVKTKTPATQTVDRTTFDPEFLTRFIAHQQRVILNAVATGLFSAAPPGAWNCSERFCGYWHVCRWGGKR